MLNAIGTIRNSLIEKLGFALKNITKDENHVHKGSDPRPLYRIG